MERFSRDADLLAYEPGVFVDVPLGAQRRVRAEGVEVSGATVSSAGGGLSVLGEGDVVVLGDEPGQWTAYAVAEGVDDGEVLLTSAPAGLTGDAGVTLEGRTFEPQAKEVCAALLRAVGIDAEAAAAGLGAESVVSVDVMRKLEVLGTLSLAYAAGVGTSGEQEAIERKAARYRAAFERGLRGARVLIDTDGDGRADVWRTPGVARLTRG